MQAYPDCLKQAECYYQVMQRMPQADRKAFLAVYNMAPRPQALERNVLKGDHVRLAMIESLLHPGLAYWVRMNLSVRVAKKLAQTTGRHQQARKLDVLLESFHVAADAFALELSLPVALARRQEKAGQAVPEEAAIKVKKPPVGRPEATRLVLPVLGISADEVALIQLFKRRVIPGLVQSIRQGERSRTAS